MANKNEYPTTIPVNMQLCAYSDYCNQKQSVQINFSPFLLLLCKTAVILLPSCTLVVILFQHLLINVLQGILFVAMHETALDNKAV